MKKLISIFVVILLSSSVALAANVQKTEWFKHMSNELPKAICMATQFDNCDRITSLIVDACLNRAWPKIPDVFEANEGARYGEYIGNCAEDLLNTLGKY